MPDVKELDIRSGPLKLLPMPHPKEDRCGHDFPIAGCPYERCVARQLYEALKDAEGWVNYLRINGCDGGAVVNSLKRIRAALANTALPSRPAVGGETGEENAE